MIWLGLTKSFGSAQNLSIPGPNSRQLIAFGILRPSRHSPAAVKFKQNSQTIICAQSYRKSYRIGFATEHRKLRVTQSDAALHTRGRLIDQPKICGTLTVLGLKILERALVQQHRLEYQHLYIKGPRLHRLAVARKDGHAKLLALLQGEPVAVGTLHGVDTTHCVIGFPKSSSGCSCPGQLRPPPPRP